MFIKFSQLFILLFKNYLTDNNKKKETHILKSYMYLRSRLLNHTHFLLCLIVFTSKFKRNVNLILFSFAFAFI
jgi:hypothetical protein